ncbi:MAG: T9SS type A sorting domain-containing protein [Flavisolibacter sp.]
MKRLYSVLTATAVILTNALSAQTGTISTINPNPIPGFGTPLTISDPDVNGFSSTNQNTLGAFPKNKTTEITSPEYYYTGSQTTMYFKYTLSNAASQTTNATAVISVIYGTPAQTLSYNAGPKSFTSGGGVYYFTFTPTTAFPANTPFRIKLQLTVSNDKTITATSLATNALLYISPIILPVKLVNFNGSLSKSTVQLQWLIADNQTADKFEIQRSTDGVSFTTASTMTATHKTGDENYSFSETATSGKVLYRLKMYDNNANAEYSKVLVFNATATNQAALQVLTNPVKDKLIISFSNASSEAAQVHIYDNSGRMVQKQTLTVSQGINTTTIALNGNYKAGLYIVELVTKAGSLSQKIIYSNQ